eukprot:CAMPEP_0196787444 /NCGR_PEP_ID=MMETSP1104-20130614/23119_1 /TAXON_ID=33652 /ORGANISM="Cafeteria sp., Strain Caron Lab Isolate" /LENGTH=35 /DNA_ID= /DNA_START= /DNA_END= /DNA_ORIENTATION=
MSSMLVERFMANTSPAPTSNTCSGCTNEVRALTTR